MTLRWGLAATGNIARTFANALAGACLLYTSDAADERVRV